MTLRCFTASKISTFILNNQYTFYYKYLTEGWRGFFIPRGRKRVSVALTEKDWEGQSSMNFTEHCFHRGRYHFKIVNSCRTYKGLAWLCLPDGKLFTVHQLNYSRSFMKWSKLLWMLYFYYSLSFFYSAALICFKTKYNFSPS